MTFEEFKAEIRARWPGAKFLDHGMSGHTAYIGRHLVEHRPKARLSWRVYSYDNGPDRAGTTLDDALADLRAELRSQRDDIDEALAALDSCQVS